MKAEKVRTAEGLAKAPVSKSDWTIDPTRATKVNDRPSAMTSCEVQKLSPAHALVSWVFSRQATATVANPTASIKRPSTRRISHAPTTPTMSCGAATHSNTRPVSSGRYPCIAPRKAGTSKAMARIMKRNPNKLVARIRMFRCPRNGIFTSGLGDRHRRIVATMIKKAALTSIATITPDPNQSKRSPWSSAPKIKLKPILAYKKPAQLTLGFGPVRAGGCGIAR